MGADLLPRTATPGGYGAALLEFALAALTHRFPLVRRLSFALLLLLCCLAVVTTARVRRLAADPALQPRPHVEPVWHPVPQTPVQAVEYARLEALVHSKRSAYDPALFAARALAAESSSVVGVTAVVLHWKRRKGLQLVLEHISRYPYVREVIVWNNRGDVDLVASDFRLSSPPNSVLGPPVLRIYNSPSNIHDAGKHFACTLASYAHCYFNDDDWLNVYMDALYTKYIDLWTASSGGERGRIEGGIVSNTLPIIHLEHRRWRFANPDVALHTGFTWLGTGSFAPREFSIRFQSQQSAAPVLLRQEQILVSDMFFSLWTNSYPEQMSNNLVPIDVEGGEVGWSRGSGVDQWAVVYGNILDAVRKLYTILSDADPSLCPDPFPLHLPPPESHLRAPCGNDLCLFSTSLTPFPDPSTLQHPILPVTRSLLSRVNLFTQIPAGQLMTDGRLNPWRLKHVRELEKQYNEIESGWPSDAWWIKNGSWHLAVDGKPDSCWESWQPPELDAHFGLTFVAPLTFSKLVITGSKDLKNVQEWEDTLTARDESWDLLTQGEAGDWHSRRFLSPPTSAPQADDMNRVTLSLAPLVGPNQLVRRMKFVSRGRKGQKLRVCGFELDGVVI